MSLFQKISIFTPFFSSPEWTAEHSICTSFIQSVCSVEASNLCKLDIGPQFAYKLAAMSQNHLVKREQMDVKTAIKCQPLRISGGGYKLIRQARAFLQMPSSFYSFLHWTGVTKAAIIWHASPASNPWQWHLCILKCMTELEVVVSPGNWSQVSEPVSMCFDPAQFISKEAVFGTIK